MAKKQENRPAGEKIDFESALSELETVVHDLEEGEIGLSEALARYEQGVKLLRQCHEFLDGAQRRIELLTGVDSQGCPISEAIDDVDRTLEEKADRRSHRAGGRSIRPEELGSFGGGDIDDSKDVV